MSSWNAIIYFRGGLLNICAQFPRVPLCGSFPVFCHVSLVRWQIAGTAVRLPQSFPPSAIRLSTHTCAVRILVHEEKSMVVFLLLVFLHIRYSYCTVLRSRSACVAGLDLRLLLLQDATWPRLIIGVWPPQLTFPKLGAILRGQRNPSVWWCKLFHFKTSHSSSLPSIARIRGKS